MPKRTLRFVISAVFILIFSLCGPVIAARKTVLLLPLSLYADESKAAYLVPGLKSMFFSRLPGEDIEVIPEGSVTGLLSDEDSNGVTSLERATQLAGRLHADYVVFGSIASVGTGYSLDLSVCDLTRKERPVTHIAEALAEDQFIPQMDDVVYRIRAAIAGIDIRAQRTARRGSGEEGSRSIFHRVDSEEAQFEPAGRITLRMDVMSLDAGDIDGDGKTELAALGREKLQIYRAQGETFAVVDTLSSSLGEFFFKVSMGDGDGDGKWEIYVVSLYGGRARTSVYNLSDGLKLIDQRPGHMQIMREPTLGKTLVLYQDSQFNPFFNGGIHLVKVGQNGKWEGSKPLPALDNAQFYTVTPIDLNGDGRPEFAGLSQNSRITLWTGDGEVLWEDDDKSDGTNNAFFLKQDNPVDPARLAFNSRIVFADVDKDGKAELISPSNTPLIAHVENLVVYVKSRIRAYKITGTKLSRVLTTRSMKYCITDMQTTDNVLFVAAQVGRVSNIGSGKSRIMWFK